MVSPPPAFPRALLSSLEFETLYVAIVRMDSFLMQRPLHRATGACPLLLRFQPDRTACLKTVSGKLGPDAGTTDHSSCCAAAQTRSDGFQALSPA
jgi:hypothetical protein